MDKAEVASSGAALPSPPPGTASPSTVAAPVAPVVDFVGPVADPSRWIASSPSALSL